MVSLCILAIILGIGYFFFFVRNLVCYTAVFSVVTQSSLWGGALRDDTKNGCVADYTKSCAFFFSSAKTAQLPSLLLSLFLSISVQLPSIVSVNIFQILSTLAGYEELPGGFKPTKSAEIFWTNIFFVFTYSPEYGAQAELHVRLYSTLMTWGRICPRRMGCYSTRAWSTGNHFPGNSVYRWKGSGWALTQLDS